MRHVLAVVSLALAFGCQKDNPNFCDPNMPDLACHNMVDGSMPDAAACDDTPPCDVGHCKDGTCVPCIVDAHCGMTMPICNPTTNECERCTEHAQCTESGVCNFDNGQCVPSTDVAYVLGGQGDTDCSKATPCGTLTRAVTTTTKSIFKVSGNVMHTSEVQLNSRSGTIYAEPMMTTVSRSGGGPIFRLDGASNVTIYDLAVTGPTTSSGSCVETLSGFTGTLTLQRVTLTKCAGSGLTATGTGHHIVNASKIAENELGGIDTSATARFTITNTFIVRNGSTSSAYGGVRLGATMANNSRFEFNTVAGNNATQAALSSGLYCNIPGFDAANNIIANNRRDGTASAQTFATGVCTYSASTVQDDTTGLVFVNSSMSPYDYHLQAGSTSAIDMATAASNIDTDADGQPRPAPAGGAKDRGADELQ